MENLPKFLLIMLVSMMTIELIWSLMVRKTVYSFKDSLSNFSMAIVSNLIKPLTLVWSYWVFTLFTPLQLFSLPANSWTFLLAFVVTDFMYYWWHRFNHEVPVLWSLHHTHHSSQWMNFTIAMRLNWVVKFLIPVFFAPLVILGLPPVFITAALALALFFQFFLHTEAVPALGKLEGKLINTPSAHRVHHGSNQRYLDKNYGGFFILWDRLFGTYQAEVEPVNYGTTDGFAGYNPFSIQFKPLWNWLRRATGAYRGKRLSG